jgi:hypothetical protein
MGPAVETVIDHYEAHLVHYRSGDPTFATLAPRRGGPVEQGYPEDPKKKSDAQALNVEAP